MSFLSGYEQLREYLSRLTVNWNADAKTMVTTVNQKKTLKRKAKASCVVNDVLEDLFALRRAIAVVDQRAEWLEEKIRRKRKGFKMYE